ncbi:LacI family DNA-binding transcriptional regulator [Stella sp.]|uniref:LacI family DNA-binding transcriptional regulator n=1 Tax=Stella sp. TaxID=2912054 RepID=UPI0035AF6060
MSDASTGRGRRPRGASGRPRIEDVAAAAGTTAITVSRTLRQPDKVAPETRRRVMEAIEALGYIPNLSASALASRRSGIMALVVPTIANSVFAETVDGFSEVAGRAGLQILLGQGTYSPEAEHALLTALAGRQPDALARIGIVRRPETRALLKRTRIPIAETWDLTDDPIDLVVGFSNRAAGRAMTRHLLARGRRRIAYIGSDDDRAAARRHGYAEALAETGLEPAAPDIRVQEITYGAGRRALRALLQLAPEADAAFCANDVLAVGALLECRKVGVVVPDQLAIAGLGDLEIAQELTPALTTVRVPSRAIGARAAELLLARIAGEPVERRVVDLGFEIVERESV